MNTNLLSVLLSLNPGSTTLAITYLFLQEEEEANSSM